MIRLLFFAALVYLGYRAAKRFMSLTRSGERKDFDRTSGEIDDIMVKDPYCQTYFPKRNGVHLRHEGKDLYFCSRECREKFIEKVKRSP